MFQKEKTIWDVVDENRVEYSIPDNRLITHRINVNGEYKLKDNIFLNLSYDFEYLNADDYKYDLPATDPTYANRAFGGEGDPSYNVHAAGLYLKIKW